MLGQFTENTGVYAHYTPPATTPATPPPPGIVETTTVMAPLPVSPPGSGTETLPVADPIVPLFPGDRGDDSGDGGQSATGTASTSTPTITYPVPAPVTQVASSNSSSSTWAWVIGGVVVTGVIGAIVWASMQPSSPATGKSRQNPLPVRGRRQRRK
jgi:hypothetical protein